MDKSRMLRRDYPNEVLEITHQIGMENGGRLPDHFYFKSHKGIRFLDVPKLMDAIEDRLFPPQRYDWL